MDEFVEKIRRARDARAGNDFAVVARAEALVAGQRPVGRWSAPAPMPTRAPTPSWCTAARACRAGCWRWCAAGTGRAPLVVVPTTYHTITAAELEDLGVKVVIYANQGLRSALRAMQETAEEILRTGSSTSVEPRIASVATVLEMSGTMAAAEAAQAERRPARRRARRDDRRALLRPAGGSRIRLLQRRARLHLRLGLRLPGGRPRALPAGRAEDLAVGAAVGAWLGGRRRRC